MPLQDFQEPRPEQILVAIAIKVQTITFMKPEGGYVNVKKKNNLFMCKNKEKIVFVGFLP